MAVLVEATSVIIRRKAIDEKFLNGWDGFKKLVPNSTLCFDEELVRVGFMSPQDVQAFVYKLQERGLTFLRDNRAIDIAVVDQQQGVTTECDWLMFSHFKINESGNKVAVCWLIPEKRIPVASIHMPANWQPGERIKLATPPGWTYENSLSQKFGFVKNENVNKLDQGKRNMSQDKCRHGMLRDTCAICQAPPEYEMKEETFEGNPVVELLHNGGPIHERDEHFKFGKNKARLLLACIDIVEELAATHGDERPKIKNQEFVDTVSGYRIFARVESFFQLSGGRRVNVPWVHLQSGRYPDLHIGFGRRKAKAIVVLRSQLAKWANYPLVDK